MRYLLRWSFRGVSLRTNLCVFFALRSMCGRSDERGARALTEQGCGRRPVALALSYQAGDSLGSCCAVLGKVLWRDYLPLQKTGAGVRAWNGWAAAFRALTEL